MFNKIKGLIGNFVENVKYIFKGIKKLFSKAKDDIDRIALGAKPDMDSLEVTANVTLIAAGVCAVLMVAKNFLSPVAFGLMQTITAIVVELVVVRSLIVYGAKDDIIAHAKEEADATE